jgi:hypothetical protein
MEGVKIGMNLNSAVKQLSKDFFVEKTKMVAFENDEAEYEYVVYSGKTKKETLFTFNGGYENVNADNVFRIVIKSPKYYTAEGICVGMNMDDLKQKAQLKSADFNYNDGLYIASEKFDGGYWMDVDLKKHKGFNFEEPEINNLPGDLKIKAIILF